MDGRRRNELHPIGYSGAKGEYRVGVHAGNYAEEILAADARGRPGFLLDKDCLWGVDKAHNRRVPVTVQAYSASTERARKLAEEAAASPYRTVEQDTLAAAAADAAARAAAKPPQARPRDEQGQDTQVGRKAAGEFTGMLDNDWVRIGLRKP
ncbi:hypothetical protein COHA_007453 [Chlorella ohadii]|uniref:Uncharacterized protein n=1 Tax=Chlorella ohadii TaxID=2649997 RepID=A0AAD5DLW6_9CHLO|nr:hypothetical protein COHA_007453 [Chlorella ohadii]